MLSTNQIPTFLKRLTELLISKGFIESFSVRAKDQINVDREGCWGIKFSKELARPSLQPITSYSWAHISGQRPSTAQTLSIIFYKIQK